MKQKQVFLIPQYMKDFACLGSACKEPCCNGFEKNIPVDHATYSKYSKVTDSKIKKQLVNYVKKKRKDFSEHCYAEIVSDSHNLCPFLNEEGLCHIQLSLGEDYLPEVCYTYPRVTNIVDGVVEVSCSLSCPEAVRLALLSSDGIQFDEIEDSLGRNYIVKQLDTTINNSVQKPEVYFWQLRIFTIKMLQNRSYDLSDRLIILGMFYQKVQDYIEFNNLDNIARLITDFNHLVDTGTIKEGLSGIPVQPVFQIELLIELVDRRFARSKRCSRLQELFAKSVSSIGYSEKIDMEEMVSRYQKAFKENYQPFMKEHHYIIENYLVNYVFMSAFPFSGYNNVFIEYTLMVIQYSIIKLILIGISDYYKGLDVNLVLSVIQSFFRTIGHSKQYLKDMIDLLQKNGYVSMPHMAILIKN